MRLRFLRGQVSLAHVLVLNAVTVVLVAVLALGVGAAGAAAPQAFQPAGQIRIASAKTADAVDVHSSAVNVLFATFTVPAGKHADIQATYNALIMSEDLGAAVGLCSAGMKLDAGPFLSPGSPVLLDKGVDDGSGFYGETRTLQAMKNNVGAGYHTLTVIGGAGGNGCWYGPGTLFVVADIHS